jgi:hypothetical protein
VKVLATAAWLAQRRASLAFTTYQTGKLFLVGLQPDGRLSIFERTFNRTMGLCAGPATLYLGTLFQLWRFDHALEPGQAHQGYDRALRAAGRLDHGRSRRPPHRGRGRRPGVVRPMAIGLKTDEIRRVITVGEPEPL